MGFLSQRFPERITRGAIGGPTYSTTVAYLPSGVEQRNANQARARHRYDVSQGIKNAVDHKVCDAFFRKARGRLHAFRVKDWADYQLARADSRLVPITSTTSRVCKVYGGDEPSFEEVRPLTRLVAGTLKIWKNGTQMTLAGGAGPLLFTVDVDTGIVTFGEAPGAATLEASCEFDVPCRFDFDDKQAELVHRQPDGTMWLRWESIRLVEDMRG